MRVRDATNGKAEPVRPHALNSPAVLVVTGNQVPV
jgi:hypothetical protein